MTFNPEAAALAASLSRLVAPCTVAVFLPPLADGLFPEDAHEVEIVDVADIAADETIEPVEPELTLEAIPLVNMEDDFFVPAQPVPDDVPGQEGSPTDSLNIEPQEDYSEEQFLATQVTADMMGSSPAADIAGSDTGLDASEPVITSLDGFDPSKYMSGDRGAGPTRGTEQRDVDSADSANSETAETSIGTDMEVDPLDRLLATQVTTDLMSAGGNGEESSDASPEEAKALGLEGFDPSKYLTGASGAGGENPAGAAPDMDTQESESDSLGEDGVVDDPLDRLILTRINADLSGPSAPPEPEPVDDEHVAAALTGFDPRKYLAPSSSTMGDSRTVATSEDGDEFNEDEFVDRTVEGDDSGELRDTMAMFRELSALRQADEQ